MDITGEYRKIQGIMGMHSYSLILPKQYAIDIGLSKGDYVRIRKVDRKLIVEKASEVPWE
jgi:antitoxin component of MazEF toxin-antitoxin module